MKRIYSILLIVVLGMASCSDWLGVQPKTSIKEEDLFKSESGFKDVLTGFYLKMGTEDLYSKSLTYGYMDMLAQRYDNVPTIYKWEEVYNYQGSYKSTKDKIFLTMYNLIANINNFLYYLDLNREVIRTEHYYEMMKGEALGLRAFLHFDLLRMFGPVYSNNPTTKAIPYRTVFNNQATPVLPANEVVDLVLADLHEADSLLDKHDSKLFEVEELQADRIPFIQLRQLRMNTCAVKAMLARVYCYKGDAESRKLAMKYAWDVINEPYFTMSTDNQSNKVLFGEHIFGLNIYEFEKVIQTDFLSTQASALMSNKEESIRDLFEIESGGASDFRGKESGFKLVVGVMVLQKFVQEGYDTYNGADVMPLIRLPEMYYILAECTTDPGESAELLNFVRGERGIPSSDDLIGDEFFDKLDRRPSMDGEHTVRVNELMKEYQKEFFGEGQLFYFYKRHNYKTFWHCPLKDIREKYVFPLPDNEIIFGNNN